MDEVLPREPLRQWVLSVPFALRYLFATDPAVIDQVLGIVTRAITSHLLKAAGLNHSTVHTFVFGASNSRISRRCALPTAFPSRANCANNCFLKPLLDIEIFIINKYIEYQHR